LLLVGDQVSVASNHLFRLMANPSVDEPLVDSRGRTIRTERMAEDVPGTGFRPFGARDSTLEVIVRFVSGDR
jgi:hypothetical protein